MGPPPPLCGAGSLSASTLGLCDRGCPCPDPGSLFMQQQHWEMPPGVGWGAQHSASFLSMGTVVPQNWMQCEPGEIVRQDRRRNVLRAASHPLQTCASITVFVFILIGLFCECQQPCRQQSSLFGEADFSQAKPAELLRVNPWVKHPTSVTGPRHTAPSQALKF